MQLSSVVAFMVLLTVSAAPHVRAQPARVEFRAKVPSTPQELVVYALQAPDSAEVMKQVEQLLSSISQADPQRPLKLDTPLGQDRIAAYDETGSLRAWVDRQTGDAAIYPRLSRVKSEQLDEPGLLKRASVALYELFPNQGEGSIVPGATRLLRHARAYRDGRPSAAVDAQLLYVSGQRQLDLVASTVTKSRPVLVEGPGSSALVALDGQGRVQALNRRWRSASPQLLAPARPSDVREQIVEQLSAVSKAWNAAVLSVSLVYYDGGQALLQPAYRFIVELTDANSQAESAPSYLLGYVPYADLKEPLPALTQQQAGPGLARDLSQPAGPAGKAKPISVGRYVARNAALGFVRDADEFWSALTAAPSGSAFLLGDFLFSEPPLFTTQSQSFIHRMHVALIEGHGFPGGFMTNGAQEPVNIADIPAQRGRGFEHWVLHACSVIATPDEAADWAKPWWSWLARDSSVVGYHTPMYINDEAGAAYAESLGSNAPRLGGWFDALASLSAYGDNPYGCTAHERAALGGAAAIASCSLEDGALPRSNININIKGRASATQAAECLDIWWAAGSAAKSTATLDELDKLGADDMCELGGRRGVITSTYTESCVGFVCASEGCGASCVDTECAQWEGCSP